MIDVEGYLSSKGVNFRSNATQIYTHCFFCNEPVSNKPGRLYINNTLTDRRGLYHCKLCDAKGAFGSIQKHFGDEVNRSYDDSSQRIIAKAAKLYYAELREVDIKWLEDSRGLTRDTIKARGLGYAPGGTFLYSALRDDGYTEEEILGSGMARKYENGVRDWFQKGITIPFFAGNLCVSLRFRNLGDSGAKYLSPQGANSRLFNVNTTYGAEELVVCEGEFDAMVMEQLGYCAVGMPGSETWDTNWNSYADDAKRVWIVTDPDEAGMKGADKVEEALGAKSKIVPLPIPEGVDAKKVDPTYLVVHEGWDRKRFDELFSSTTRRNTLIRSPLQAWEAWIDDEAVGGLKTGFEKFDHYIGKGIRRSDLVIPVARTNVGKGGTLSEKILTPSGWTTYGEIEVGDQVVGSNGKPTRVDGVFPRGVLDVYKVTFTDGTCLRVDGEHLWSVSTSRRLWANEADLVLSTEDLMGRMTNRTRDTRFFVPAVAPVEFVDPGDRPLDPYVLGALIGDGSITANVDLTSADPFIPEFIPKQYLLAPVADRLAVLQGLMDTDGSPDADGSHAEFGTSSPQLAKDVQFLVESLGGHAQIKVKKTTHLDCHRLHVVLPPGIVPFRLPRKVDRYKLRQKTHRRAIAGIEPDGRDEVVCISVEADDSLYVTEHFIVTHNTMLLLNLFQRMSDVPGQRDLKMMLFTLEQTSAQWFDRARKIWNFYNLECEPEKVNEEAAMFWEGRLRLVEKNLLREEEILGAIDDYRADMGDYPDVIALDYLGYLSRGYVGGQTIDRVSAAAQSMKGIAKEINRPIITPSQASRKAGHGEEVGLDDARDSGEIENTADIAIGLWSQDTMKGMTADDRNGELIAKLIKTRGPGRGKQVKFYFAPLTLAWVPEEETRHVPMVKSEIGWDNHGDITWEEAIYSHKTGLPPKGRKEL